MCSQMTASILAYVITVVGRKCWMIVKGMTTFFDGILLSFPYNLLRSIGNGRYSCSMENKFCMDGHGLTAAMRFMLIDIGVSIPFSRHSFMIVWNIQNFLLLRNIQCYTYFYGHKWFWQWCLNDGINCVIYRLKIMRQWFHRLCDMNVISNI